MAVTETILERFGQDYPMLAAAISAHNLLLDEARFRGGDAEYGLSAYRNFLTMIMDEGILDRKLGAHLPPIPLSHLRALRGIADPFERYRSDDPQKLDDYWIALKVSLDLFLRLPATCLPESPDAWLNLANWAVRVRKISEPNDHLFGSKFSNAMDGWGLALQITDDDVKVVLKREISSRFANGKSKISGVIWLGIGRLAAYGAYLAGYEEEFIDYESRGDARTRRQQTPAALNDMDFAELLDEMKTNGIASTFAAAATYWKQLKPKIVQARRNADIPKAGDTMTFSIGLRW